MKPRCSNECAEDIRRLNDEKAALIMAAAKPKDSFAWLIEAPGQRYLAVQRLKMSDSFEWTTDHNKALRFCSQEQADALMMAVRQMDREIGGLKNHNQLSSGALFAFEATLGNAKAVEHGWISAAAL